VELKALQSSSPSYLPATDPTKRQRNGHLNADLGRGRPPHQVQLDGPIQIPQDVQGLPVLHQVIV
jgi:hypothetical protein